MAVRTISTRLAIEGEAQYRAALTSINSELRTLQSALKLTQSDFAGNANSMAALTAKGEALKNLYDAQARKVQELSAALQNAQSAVTAYQTRNDTLRSTIDANSKALSQMDSATQAAGSEWADQAKIVSSAEAELKKLQKSSEDTSAAQADLKAKIDAAKQKMAELEKSTGGAAKAAGTLITENEKLNAELSENERHLDAATRGANDWQTKLNNAKVELNDLDSEIKKNDQYLDEAANSADGCATSINEFGEETKETTKAVDSLAQALVAAGVAKAAKEIAQSLMECVNASVAFESSMAGVAKTTDLSGAALTAMSESVAALSMRIPIAATDLAGVMEIAGQLGVKADALLNFTEVMANLGVATNLTSQDAATMLAQFTAVTGMDTSFYSNLGSAIVALGNNFATDERRIAEMSQRLAAAGTLAGLTEPEILALATAMSSVGIESQAGGTAMSQTLTQMEKAVASGGEALDRFAQIAGMTSEEFAIAWSNEPMVAIQGFIAGLGMLSEEGGSATLVLEEMGLSGIRQSNMLKSLALASDKVSSAVALSNSAWQENTALTKEAATKYATTESKIKLFENSVTSLKRAVGDQLTPAIGELAETGADVIQWATEFVEKNEWLGPTVVALATALGVLAAALAGYTLVVKVAIPAITAFNAALAANPFGAVALAITAVVAAISAFAIAMSAGKESYDQLSETSKRQYNELERLNEEYKHACDIYGETSKEALALKEQVDTATAAFEENRQSAEDVATAHQAVINKQAELAAQYQETVRGIEEQKSGTGQLIERLQELMSVESKTAAVKEEILSIVRLLNGAIPSLALSYDTYTDSLNMTAEAIIALAEAEYELQQREADRAALDQAIADRAELQENLTKVTEEATAAQENLTVAEENYAAAAAESAAKFTGGEAGGRAYALAMIGVTTELDAARKAQEEANAALDDAQAAYNGNEQEIQELGKALAGASAEATDAGSAMEQAASAVTPKLQELAQAYKDAYDSARESLDGQYDLWEKVEEKAAISATTILEANDSQVDYYKSYAENLQALLDRGIPGIEKLASTFTETSAESAAALAGLAVASDEEIAAIIASMAEVDAYKDTLASVFAELDVDLQGSLDALSESYTETVSELTSGDIDFTPFLTAVETAFEGVGVTFETAGTDAGDGLAAGIDASKGGAETASTAMAQAVIDACRNALQSHSPSQVMHDIGTGIPEGLAGGIDETAPKATTAIDTMAGDIVTAMETAGADAVDGFMSEFNTITEKTRSTLSGLSSVVSSATSGLSSSMYSVGSNMIGGMISGLNSRSSALYSTVWSIVNKAISTARSAAEVHSPSKKTEAIFEEVGEGMILGLDNKTEELNAKTQRMVDNALSFDIGQDMQQIIRGIDDQMPVLLASLTPMTGDDNRSFDNSISVTIKTPQISVRSEADIDDLAREISERIAEDASREIRYQGGSLMGGRS